MARSTKPFKSMVSMVRQTQALSYFPFATSSKCNSLLSQFCIIDVWYQAGSEYVYWISAVWVDLHSLHLQLMKDSNFQLKSLLAESAYPAQQIKTETHDSSNNWFASAAIVLKAYEKYTCYSAPVILVSEEGKHAVSACCLLATRFKCFSYRFDCFSCGYSYLTILWEARWPHG